MTKLKQDFKKTRIAEYQSIKKIESVSHSCTKGSSNGTKNCGSKYIKPPSNEFYTKEEWIETTEGSGGKITFKKVITRLNYQ